ncbi:GNAT family N-acetyltransferase [Streptomonospora salina]|uniref:GNAT superfamily N-acetyltransferase n=1 Tax=Streptomonospora salina TaxID=104205 RepID=A0A841ECQ3_9ACTN|nr:GNAT family N-acetyltransferase [Streptomonospora salina]MBB6000892.1 GNAT superfamily N-acetyltransferase [Streptomonospora salina]
MADDRTTLRRPERAELPAVAEAYTAANLHDPVLSWVIDDEDARRRITAGPWRETMVAYLDSVLHSGELVIAEDESAGVAGVALWEWTDPAPATGTSPLQDPEGARFIEHAYGEYADRMKQLMELTGRRRPDASAYWYLLNIVVAPRLRGQGIGGAMLRTHLRRLEAEHAPAFLEASSPRNRRLYESFGFADCGEPVELPDGPRLQPMWRPAAADPDRSRSKG